MSFPGVQNTGIAIVINGNKHVFLNPQFLGQPPAVQTFFLYHELAHHYFEHHGGSCQFREFQSDAFAIRVLAFTSGEFAARQVGDWFRGLTGTTINACQAALTHPACVDRATYIDAVLATVLQDFDPLNPVSFSQLGPNPPVLPSTCAVPPQASIILRNEFSVEVGVGINGVVVGTLLPFQISQQLPVAPGFYTADLVGSCFDPFLGQIPCALFSITGSLQSGSILTNLGLQEVLQVVGLLG